MKPILYHPSWHDIEKGVAKLGHLMLNDNINPKWVIGLTRGGLVPAVIMSHMLELPMMPVNYSSKDGNGDNKNHQNSLPHIPVEHKSGEFLRKTPDIIIIDDVCDSGRTMIEVAQHYTNLGHTVHTASLYYKESSIFKPDYYWHQIPADSDWIIFPWE